MNLDHIKKDYNIKNKNYANRKNIPNIQYLLFSRFLLKFASVYNSSVYSIIPFLEELFYLSIAKPFVGKFSIVSFAPTAR